MSRKGEAKAAFAPGVALALTAGLSCSVAAPDGLRHPPPFAAAHSALVDFDVTPFPYRGDIPGSDRPFLDVKDGERLGHTSPRGGVRFEDEAYFDKRVLLSAPASFDPKRPFAIVVFFHGNNATLERDVLRRQEVAAQLARARLNAVLVAPQFAVNSLDSSAGGFWRPGAFNAFIKEAAERLAVFVGDGALKARFAQAPLILVAYSGGYNPAAYSLDVGGADGRIRGVILLDALYGEVDRFAEWIKRDRNAFFVSAYSKSSQPQNADLKQKLVAGGVAARNGLDGPLAAGGVYFVPALGDGIAHNDFVTRAWVSFPLTAVLTHVEGFAAAPRASRASRPHAGPAIEPAPQSVDDEAHGRNRR